MIKSAEDVKRLGTILCVGAHPDDETWLAGGVLAAAAANGQRVMALTATKGEAGQTSDAVRWPQADLAQIRVAELKAALGELGVEVHSWLGCRDGACDQENPEQMALRLAKFIHDEKPNSLLTFGPEGLTGHSDHAAVSAWCTRAVELDGTPTSIYHVVHTPDWYQDHGKRLHEVANVFFNIDEPPLVEPSGLAIDFHLPAEVCEKKLAALKAQPSQMEHILKAFGDDELPAAFREESFIKA